MSGYLSLDLALGVAGLLNLGIVSLDGGDIGVVLLFVDGERGGRCLASESADGLVVNQSERAAAGLKEFARALVAETIMKILSASCFFHVPSIHIRGAWR